MTKIKFESVRRCKYISHKWLFAWSLPDVVTFNSTPIKSNCHRKGTHLPSKFGMKSWSQLGFQEGLNLKWLDLGIFWLLTPSVFIDSTNLKYALAKTAHRLQRRRVFFAGGRVLNLVFGRNLGFAKCRDLGVVKGERRGRRRKRPPHPWSRLLTRLSLRFNSALVCPSNTPALQAIRTDRHGWQ